MKRNKQSKWTKIAELQQHLANDSTGETIKEGDIERIMYGFYMNAAGWIFKYKGLYVMLWDAGNGHYEFGTAITRAEVIKAWIMIRAYNIKRKIKGEKI